MPLHTLTVSASVMAALEEPDPDPVVSAARPDNIDIDVEIEQLALSNFE